MQVGNLLLWIGNRGANSVLRRYARLGQGIVTRVEIFAFLVRHSQ